MVTTDIEVLEFCRYPLAFLTCFAIMHFGPVEFDYDNLTFIYYFLFLFEFLI